MESNFFHIVSAVFYRLEVTSLKMRKAAKTLVRKLDHTLDFDGFKLREADGASRGPTLVFRDCLLLDQITGLLEDCDRLS